MPCHIREENSAATSLRPACGEKVAGRPDEGQSHLSTNKNAGALTPAFRISTAKPYSASTILPSSHLKSEKLCEVRSPVSP